MVNGGTVLCVGMCVLDIVHNCAEYPQEDTDKRCLQSRLQRGGNASNNCTVLSQLGAKCEFLGMLSSSTAFSILPQDCLKRGISIENCPTTEQDPPYSSVILSEKSGSRTIIHANNNFPILTNEHFKRLRLHNYSWIHFEARNPTETSQMMQQIKNYNSTVSANQAIKISLEIEKCRAELLDLIAYVDYVFIGRDLALHMGWESKREAVNAIATLHSVQVICTWGSEGCASWDECGNYLEHASVPVSKIVDSLGAGDTFCAATIYALNNLQMTLSEAVHFGNRCAAFKLQHNGYDQINKFKQLINEENCD